MNQWLINLRNETEDPTIYITGDFNLKFLKDWNYEVIQNFYNSVSEKVNTNNATSVDKIQAMKLIDFVNSHYLNQKVVTPTREDNILDYVFTKKENFVKYIKVEINLYLSDHNTIISEIDMTEIVNTEDK